MGRRYTDDELKVLDKFIEDHSTITNTSKLAELVKSYGMFPERSVKALEMAIRKQKNPQHEGNQEDYEQMALDLDPVTAIMESDYKKLLAKYEGLMDAVLGKAQPYTIAGGRIVGITFDFNAIKAWLYENEPRRISAWMEDHEEL